MVQFRALSFPFAGPPFSKRAGEFLFVGRRVVNFSRLMTKSRLLRIYLWSFLLQDHG